MRAARDAGLELNGAAHLFGGFVEDPDQVRVAADVEGAVAAAHARLLLLCAHGPAHAVEGPAKAGRPARESVSASAAFTDLIARPLDSSSPDTAAP